MTVHLTADAYLALARHYISDGKLELALMMIDYANVARWQEMNR